MRAYTKKSGGKLTDLGNWFPIGDWAAAVKRISIERSETGKSLSGVPPKAYLYIDDIE